MPSCGAQLELESGKFATCAITSMTGFPIGTAHSGRDHSVFVEDVGQVSWPCCSQYCLKDHVHGKYRLNLGQATGPATIEGRAPKVSKPARPKARQCKICLEPGELDAKGTCADKQACASRIAPLFPEVPL